MHEEMDHNGPEGFAVDTAALDRYIGQVVNPALDNFIKIANLLSATTNPTRTMLGHEHLAGSTEFTRTCRMMLNTFFNAHNVLTEKQRALVQAVTTLPRQLSAVHRDISPE